jgi:hypothetical protein
MEGIGAVYPQWRLILHSIRYSAAEVVGENCSICAMTSQALA